MSAPRRSAIGIGADVAAEPWLVLRFLGSEG
jgi:hypothetical protein